MSHAPETSVHLVSTVGFSQGTDAERVALIDAWVREREAHLIDEAAKVVCHWCLEGNIPTEEKDLCQPGKVWHKIYQNWLMCGASDIRALVTARKQQETL